MVSHRVLQTIGKMNGIAYILKENLTKLLWESKDTYTWCTSTGERHTRQAKSNKNTEMLFITVRLRVRILNLLVFILLLTHFQINRTKLNRMLFGIIICVVFYTLSSLRFLSTFPIRCYHYIYLAWLLPFSFHFLQFGHLPWTSSFIANTFIWMVTHYRQCHNRITFEPFQFDLDQVKIHETTMLFGNSARILSWLW